VIGRGRLGQLEDRLPGPDRRVLVVHPVARLGHPKQRGGRDLGIVEADDPLVGRERLGVIAALDEGGSLVEQLAGRRAIEGSPHVTVDRPGPARAVPSPSIPGPGPGPAGSRPQTGSCQAADPSRRTIQDRPLDLPRCAVGSVSKRPASELAEIFAAEPLADDPGPRFNVAPTDDALVVVQRGDRRAITAYRWGLIPHWADAAKVGSRMFNARAETLTTSPAFRDAFQRKRCLVPVDGFYEWHREGARRQPFAIARDDGRPLALAGLWSGWRDPKADRVVRTFTIITTRPNDQLAGLHDRMPVVVPDEAWERWLDPRSRNPPSSTACSSPATRSGSGSGRSARS